MSAPSLESLSPTQSLHSPTDAADRAPPPQNPAHAHAPEASQNTGKTSLDAGQLRSLKSLDSSTEKQSPPPPAKPPKSTMTRDDWRKLPSQFLKVYLLVFCMWMGLLSIYWGALYHRENRMKNMPMLVAIDDSQFQLSDSASMPPIIGDQFRQLLLDHETLGKFDFKDVDDLRLFAESRNETVLQYIQQEVHHQRYWAGMYVQRNASETVYEMLRSGSIASVAANQSQSLITVIYESGRHFSALSQYVSKNLRRLELAWTATYAPQAYAYIAQTSLDASQMQALYRSNSTQGSVLSLVPPFKLVDYRPGKSPVVLGPSELGLIYAQIFSFHQFNFSADLHNSVRQRLRFRHFVYYRILFSQINHLMLALVYGLMTLAFQVPTNVAFGKAGFMVLWATMYLFISASGGLNEFAGMLINFYDKKVLLPPWIIFNVVINISPTFAPFDLSPGFYRYGYAVPMFNAYEALKVVFFDTWKGTLGRNYGVLAGWVILSNILIAGGLIHISRTTRRRAEKKEKS